MILKTSYSIWIFSFTRNFSIFKNGCSVIPTGQILLGTDPKFPRFCTFHFHKYDPRTLTKRCKTAIPRVLGEPYSLHNCIYVNGQGKNAYFPKNPFKCVCADATWPNHDLKRWKSILDLAQPPAPLRPIFSPKITRLYPLPVGSPVPHGLSPSWRAALWNHSMVDAGLDQPVALYCLSVHAGASCL